MLSGSALMSRCSNSIDVSGLPPQEAASVRQAPAAAATRQAHRRDLLDSAKHVFLVGTDHLLHLVLAVLTAVLTARRMLKRQAEAPGQTVAQPKQQPQSADAVGLIV
ncbi:hypothetical protein [Streptomyces sp. NPDC002550]